METIDNLVLKNSHITIDVGSVEYLITKGESSACFFDINPVSTYHPKAADFLGFNPYSKLAAWLKTLAQNRAM